MEIWKDVKGYEGFYQISNTGKVKSLRNNRILKKILKIKMIMKLYSSVFIKTKNVLKYID